MTTWTRLVMGGASALALLPSSCPPPSPRQPTLPGPFRLVPPPTIPSPLRSSPLPTSSTQVERTTPSPSSAARSNSPARRSPPRRALSAMPTSRPARCSAPANWSRSIPGMVAAQHSGGGKANQYFLRGFNLDHGTDFAGSIDGVPLNLRAHPHMNGYLDINFLIPEVIEKVAVLQGHRATPRTATSPLPAPPTSPPMTRRPRTMSNSTPRTTRTTARWSSARLISARTGALLYSAALRIRRRTRSTGRTSCRNIPAS